MVVRTSRIPEGCYRPSRPVGYGAPSEVGVGGNMPLTWEGARKAQAVEGNAAGPVDPRALRANRAEPPAEVRGRRGRPAHPHAAARVAGGTPARPAVRCAQGALASDAPSVPHAQHAPCAASAAQAYRSHPRQVCSSRLLLHNPLDGASRPAGHGAADPSPYAPARCSRRPRRKLGPRARAVAVIALCMLVFGGIGSVVLNANARTGLPGGLALFGEPAPTSTPQAEWRQGQMPFLYQTDRAWASEPYAGSTVGEAGCGPTCMSMVYIYLTGRTDLDPAAMCRFSDWNGYVMDGMTAWAFMTDGAAQLGLSAREVPADAGSVISELAAGRPIIASMRPGDFTKSGHFIVLAGVDENGQLIVRDPNSASRSAEAWDIDRVLGQCAGLWSFSA